MTFERKIGLLVLPFALVALLGNGCTRSRSAVTPSSSPTPQTETQTNAMAFLRLDGGAATVMRGNVSAAAQDNAELRHGDRVKVTSGPVSIIYPDAGESRLETGADVTIVTDENTSSGLFAELRLTTGRVWTRFERLLGSDEHFSVASNGVVATVRGTAFGVTAEGTDVDVQAADHAVEVAPEVTDATQAAAVTNVAAGEGVKIQAKLLTKRKLSALEQTSEGFKFGLRHLAPERLKLPTQLLKLFQTAPAASPALEQRRVFLRQMMLQQAQPSTFAAPTRTLLPNETAPTNVAPSVKGPTGQ